MSLRNYSADLIGDIRALKEDNFSNKVIAIRVGETEDTVRWICHQHGFRKSYSGRRDIPLGIELFDIYQPEAARRRMTLPNFVRRLLRVIADDRMIDAILDDGGTRR